MEALDIPGVLERLPDGLSPIERVLAAHSGTVQLLVSLWFGEPADVVVKSQSEVDGAIGRRVILQLRESRLAACNADTTIPIGDNCAEVLALVREKKLGLGQIAIHLGIPTTRRLLEVRANRDWLVRKYDMTGQGLHYIIEEAFLRSMFASPTLRGAVAQRR